MQTALFGTALLMGLAGGPHCVAMCGAASAGVIRIVRAPAAGGDGAAVMAPACARAMPSAAAFHVGRIVGYAVAGAIVASAVQGLALAGSHIAVLRPLWSLLQAAILAWAVTLAVLGRQPPWAHRLGSAMAARLRPLAGSGWRVLATGALWVAMPCGLLYSALMLAGLGNGPAEGAAVMALFAAGSGVSLAAAPWLWRRLHGVFGPSRREWGVRLAGVLLAAVALQALWMSLAHQIAAWC